MRTKRGRRRSLFLLLVAAGLVLAARRSLAVVAVEGRSMAPALLPGDWLVVERATYAVRPPRVGETVLAADPRTPRRELIKRVARVRGGELELRGDNVLGSTDSVTFGNLPIGAVEWRAVVRYWPPRRVGLLEARAPLAFDPAEPLGGEPACTFPEALVAGEE